MVDTGADGTALSARDWSEAGIRTAHLAAPSLQSAGVGGIVQTIVEPAMLSLIHEDGDNDQWAIDIELLPRDAVSGVLPSFLGRDILRNYRLFLSIAERELRLEPVP